MAHRLPAEWESQSGILLAWPHSATDWVDQLDETLAVYSNLVKAITRFQTCVIATPDPTSLRKQLASADIPSNRLRLHAITTNDTWTRDFGPITVFDKQQPILLDFVFNGWGQKFASDLDNQATRQLHESKAFGDTELKSIDLILEGGSIESDGNGTLLTTTECLLNPNRNPHISRIDIEQSLKKLLGVERILWLKNGYLTGDDTDAHIDTLARFCPDNTIIYQGCDDTTDEHFPALSAMLAELKEFTTGDNSPYRLIPLPWPQARYVDGQRLPASYANFLIINGAVLVPTYNDPRDQDALSVIAETFPEREIIGIDCSSLIRQNGSLHCITMQIPEGVPL